MSDPSSRMPDDSHHHLHWPTVPRWTSDYPSADSLDLIETLITQHGVKTAFYKGLADPAVIERLRRHLQPDKIAVWDHFGYWRMEEQHWDDGQLGSEYWEKYSASRPDCVLGVPFYLGEGGGGPWNNSDLVILDADTTNHPIPSGQAPSEPILPRSLGRIVLLLGEIKELANQDQYVWAHTNDAAIGIRRADYVNWSQLEAALSILKEPVSKWQYLKTAFEQTERLWKEQFEKVREVHLVILSEAPLFGDTQSYFYNPQSPFTSFFFFRDAEAILGKKLLDARWEKSRFRDDNERKQFLLEKLAEAGVIVLDIFPFALNGRNTVRTYGKGNGTLRHSEYQALFRATCEHYFEKKLWTILRKGCPTYVWRYGRLQERATELVKPSFQRLVSGDAIAPQVISTSSGTLHRNKLQKAYMRAINCDPLNVAAMERLPHGADGDSCLHVVSLMLWYLTDHARTVPTPLGNVDRARKLVEKARDWAPLGVMALLHNPERPDPSSRETTLFVTEDLNEQVTAEGLALTLLGQVACATQNGTWHDPLLQLHIIRRSQAAIWPSRGEYHVLTYAEEGFAPLNIHARLLGIDKGRLVSFADSINRSLETGSLYPHAPISAVPRAVVRNGENAEVLLQRILEFLRMNSKTIRATKLICDFRTPSVPAFVLDAIETAMESPDALDIQEVVILE